MDVHLAAAAQPRVNGVEDATHHVGRSWDRDVADGEAHVLCLDPSRVRLLREQLIVWVELVRLGEIDERRNPGIEQGAELGASWRVVAIAGVLAGNQPAVE
jgi:hypothetical protein